MGKKIKSNRYLFQLFPLLGPPAREGGARGGTHAHGAGGDGAAELGHAPLFARMASLSAEVLLDPRSAGSSIPLLRTFDRGSLRLTSLRVPSPA